jgi:branched-chain amino acid transport system ATP-binding protein
MPLLELEDVEARYGAVQALHGVSLAVDEGAFVALLGANGAGKTTTLRAISGLVRRSGTIAFAGRRIDRYGTERVARLGLAHVPEGRGIVAELSVLENLRLGAWLRRDRGAKDDLEEVLGWFPVLQRRIRQPASTLSGGEQQMLALARALVGRPRLLMLDEPSLGLAPIIVRELYDILVRLNRERGLTVFVVEQNAALALDAADTAYVLEVGRVGLHGPSAELKEREAVRRAYLGY